MLLESAQVGLSWATILKKREGYRKAFDNFSSENPQLRYTVGNDAITIIQARMNMPDRSFEKW